MKWGKNIFGKISEFFTGNNARRELASATAQRNGARQQARALQGTPIGSAASAKQGWSHTSNFGPINGKNYKVIYGTGEEQRRNVAQENYNRTLPGMIDQARNAMSKAREQVSKAYSDAAAAIGKKGLDIQSFYSQVMQKAQGAINRGKNMVSKYGGQFVSQIQTLGSNALAGGKSFLEGIMKKAKQAKSKVTEPISRLKARKAEKRDAEYDVGHKSNHDRNLARERSYDKYGRGSGLGPYTPHRDQIIQYYNDYTGDQESRPGHDDNGNLIGGYKRSKGKPGNKVLDERVRDEYRISRQAYKAVDKKIKKK